MRKLLRQPDTVYPVQDIVCGAFRKDLLKIMSDRLYPITVSRKGCVNGKIIRQGGCCNG